MNTLLLAVSLLVPQANDVNELNNQQYVKQFMQQDKNLLVQEIEVQNHRAILSIPENLRVNKRLVVASSTKAKKTQTEMSE